MANVTHVCRKIIFTVVVVAMVVVVVVVVVMAIVMMVMAVVADKPETKDLYQTLTSS